MVITQVGVELSGAGRRVSQKAASSVAKKGGGCVIRNVGEDAVAYVGHGWLAGWLPFFELAARAWMKTFNDTF